jgi:ribosomal protein L30/L7E
MSFPYTPDLSDEKIESLKTQREYLNLLRLRHLQWMTLTHDPQAEDMHREIAGLIEKITDHYKRLLVSRS